MLLRVRRVNLLEGVHGFRIIYRVNIMLDVSWCRPLRGASRLHTTVVVAEDVLVIAIVVWGQSQGQAHLALLLEHDFLLFNEVVVCSLLPFNFLLGSQALHHRLHFRVLKASLVGLLLVLRLDRVVGGLQADLLPLFLHLLLVLDVLQFLSDLALKIIRQAL